MVLIALMRRWIWRLRGLIFLAPAATKIAAACLFVFLVQQGASRVEFVYGYSYEQAVVPCFALNWPLFSHGFYWQLVTYLFLHGSWLHLCLNALTVLLFGSGLEYEVGGRRLWGIFLAGGVLGGLGWLGVTALLPLLPAAHGLTAWVPAAARAWLPELGVQASLDSAMCVGASGGVFALIGAYAVLFPQRCVYLLLVVVPVRLRARTLAWLLGALTVLDAVFVQSQVAYAAHLAGGLAGVLCGVRLKRLGEAGEGA